MNNEKTLQSKKVMYDQIDALKGIAIFFVVLAHSIIYHPVNLHENAFCDYLFHWISSVHMPVFFLVSGFCFSYKEKYSKYILKKVKRLLIPYLVFNVIDCIPRYLLPGLVNRSRSLGESVIHILFNGGEFWFLYTLFAIFLIFPCIYKVIKGNLPRQICAFVISLVLYFLCSGIEIFVVNSVTSYLFYFIAGTIIKEHLGSKIWEIKLNKGILSVITVTLTAVWMLLVKILPDYLSVLSALTGIFVLYLFVQFKLPVRLFRDFGKYSLQLYLFNGLTLVASRTIIVSVLSVTNPVIIISFNMLVDFFLTYIIIKYVCAKIKPAKILMGMV